MQLLAITNSIVNSGASNLLFTNSIFFYLIKLGMIILGLIYLIYAVILLRHIQMMNETVKTSVAGTVFFMGVVHLGLAVLVWLYLLVM